MADLRALFLSSSLCRSWTWMGCVCTTFEAIIDRNTDSVVVILD